MTQDNRRSYAVGVQKFDWIREHGAAYMDKTKYVWQMVSSSTPFYFLSRPRRFGKSLLVDTLRCYFEGRKELFEGLYIYDKKTEWKKYPVIRLDLSSGKYYEKERLHSTINSILRDYEEYTYDDVVSKLKEMYDGYHFSKDMTDIYCPWSLINTFAMGDIQNFWFSTGTPTMLISVMRQHKFSMQQLEGRQYPLRRFDAPTERISDPIPVLGKTAENAVEQILSKNYAVRFAHDSRPIVAVGLNISHDRRTIDDYRIINIEK